MSNRSVVWCLAAALVGAAVAPVLGQGPGAAWEPPPMQMALCA